MQHQLSRRKLFELTAAGAVAGPLLRCQEPVPPVLEAVRTFERRSAVSLVKGESRRRNISEALIGIEDQIVPQLRRKKYAIIKPNIVSPAVPLACTHADALHGILDFLGPRFKGPVVIAESSGGDTEEGYDNFQYHRVAAEHKSQQVSLLDLNAEAKYEIIPVLDADLRVTPVRLATRLLDPEAYIICCAVLKTHNTVVATLSVKNMALGAPLRSARGAAKWSDKGRFHGSIRQQTHFDILLAAQKLQPFWGAAVIDGFEGMEGDGPISGTPVPSHVAVASTDYIAADRVGIEVMGINPAWPGYLNYCAQCGLGQFDISKLDVRGAKPVEVARKFELSKNIDAQLQWMAPMSPVGGRTG
jgi:uncharacterized protein (DUF362 family)